MSCSGVQFFFDNYVDVDILAGSDVSSAQSAFPITNAYNKQRRSKVWRSNGYFNVTSSNNKIVFRETAAVDLTASIAVAEYSSTTTFVAAVKSALEAAGGSTYTVTIASGDGYKVKIVSDGAGGGGVFHLMLTDANFTSADLLGWGTGSDITDSGLTRTADFLRINSEEFIEWDLGVATNPKGFAAIGPRNQSLKLSPGGTYKLQGNFTTNWSSPDFEVALTYSDFSLFTYSDTGLADDSYRFWRFLIQDQNPLGYVEIGAFMLGDFFNPTRGRVRFPLDVQQVDRTNILYSEGGQTYADNKPKTVEYTVRWNGLQKADVEEIEDQFAIYGTGIPFFVNIDSTATFTSSAQRRLMFCKFAREPSYQLVSPDNFELDMIIREEL